MALGTRIGNQHVIRRLVTHRSASQMSKHKSPEVKSDIKGSKKETNITIPIPYQQSFKSFSDMIRTEKEEASKFILIEDKCQSIAYHSPETLSQVFENEVTRVFRFASGPRSFSLVRLNDIESFTKTFSPHGQDKIFPIHSRILKLTSFPKEVRKVAAQEPLRNLSLERISNFRRDILTKTADPLECISKLVEVSSMTKFGSKLRFFFMHHLQDALCSGIFSHFHLLPFGSSVNEFGDDNSDVDVVMLGNRDGP